MSNQLQAVQAEALKLAPEERVQLADRLLASVFDDTEIEAAWAEEVEHRVAEIESDSARLVSATDAIARARAAIK